MSVIDSNRPPLSRQPCATRARRPPYSREMAKRSYGPAAPKASRGSSASICQSGPATASIDSSAVHTSKRPIYGLASVNSAVRAGSQVIAIIINTVSYIICEPCVGTKDTACVDVCPVDCIHPRKDEPEFDAAEMLYIHPDECINCGACVPACPVEAIFALDETPQKWTDFIGKNADYYGTH